MHLIRLLRRRFPDQRDMRDELIIVKRDARRPQRTPQFLHIRLQLLVPFHSRPEKIPEISFLRQAQPKLRQRHTFDDLLHLRRIVIFSDKRQRQVQVLRRHVIALHALLLQVMHAGDKRLFHLIR